MCQATASNPLLTMREMVTALRPISVGGTFNFDWMFFLSSLADVTPENSMPLFVGSLFNADFLPDLQEFLFRGSGLAESPLLLQGFCCLNLRKRCTDLLTS